MAHHATLLFAYGNSNDLVVAADARAMSSQGKHVSDSAEKLTICGKRGVCAVGGYSEGLVKEGSRKGWHWKLLDSLKSLSDFPSRSALDRAKHVFDAAYESAAEYMPHDTDPGTLGHFETGITVLYGEVSRAGSISLHRADMAVTIAHIRERWTWSVERPIPKAVMPDASKALPLVYIHSPEVIETLKLHPPSQDHELKGTLPLLFKEIANQTGNATIGGEIAAVRIDGHDARWL